MESHTRPGSYVRILTKDEKQTYFQVLKHLYASYVESDDVASDEEMEGLIKDETSHHHLAAGRWLDSVHSA